MSKTIVIIGGSFNPPTSAHIKMAEIFKSRVNADLVIMVPAKTEYLKNWKKYQDSDILNDKKRLEILRAVESQWLKIETCELDNLVSGSSYDTIQFIKEKYNTANVFFGIGADKLEEISRWSQSEKILSEEHFILLKRGVLDIDQILNSTQLLKEHKSSFLLCEDSYSDMRDISSTLARQYLQNQEFGKLKEIVPEVVYRILVPLDSLKDSKIRIMADVCPGIGTPIGSTFTFDDVILPSLVSSDIGCGIITCKLSSKRIE